MKRSLAVLMLLMLLPGCILTASASASQIEAWKLDWYENGNGNSANSVGISYYHGTNGVEQNYTEAVKWFGYAASKEIPEGMCYLGVCYYLGQGTEQNYEMAFQWYLTSAEEGYAIAQHNLGSCYFYGRGVEQDYSQAFEWYSRSAQQNLMSGQYALGNCYENGYGVAKDLDEAIKWYRLAAEQGHEDAYAALERLGVSDEYDRLQQVKATMQIKIKPTPSPAATAVPSSGASASSQQSQTKIVKGFDLDEYIRIKNGATPSPTATAAPNSGANASSQQSQPKIRIKINPTPVSYSALSSGSKGDAVKKLQKRLIELNYLAEGEDDGIYGKLTAQAVHLFKASYNSGSCDCSSKNKCVADAEMQEQLFRDDAEKNTGSPIKEEKKSSSSSSKKSGSSSSNSKKCKSCKGRRWCQYCAGSGRRLSGKPCTACYGGGICTFCGGTGKQGPNFF